MKKHEKELNELGKKFGVKQACSPVETDKPSSEQQMYYFPERNWASLGKKELELEVTKRGLGKKGNREELVTKLVIFHTDQKKKVENGEVDPNNLPPEPKKNGRKAVDLSEDEEKTETPVVDPSKVHALAHSPIIYMYIV